MAHITLSNNFPGISGLLRHFPDSAIPLMHLAQTLLRGESPLSEAERELIAAYTSYKNNCQFCYYSHIAAAMALSDDYSLDAVVKSDFAEYHCTDKFRMFIRIAAETASCGSTESMSELMQKAKEHGALDKELHDVVLIASAFCMYNRYVDNLGTHSSNNLEDYIDMGKRLAQFGYNQ